MSWIKIFTLSIILWFYIFSGIYYIGGLVIYPMLIFAVFGVLVIMYRSKVKKSWLVYSILISCIIFTFGFGNNTDSILIVISQSIRTLLLPLLGSVFVFGLFSKNIEYIDLVKCLFLVALFQVAITVFQLFSPDFRSVFFSLIRLADVWQSFVDVGHFRATGLSGLSLYDTSISYSLLLLIIIPLLKTSIFKEQVLLYFTSILLFILTIIAGRTGLMLLLFLFTAYYFSSRNKIWLACSTLAVTSICFSIIISLSDAGLDEVINLLELAFEPFVNLFSGNGIESKSTTELYESHLFIPEGINPFIGNGLWLQKGISGNHRGTDSGLVILYGYAGSVGLLLSIMVVIIYSYFFSSATYKLSGGSVFVFYGALIVFISYFSFCILKAPFFFQEKIMATLWFVKFAKESYVKNSVKSFR
jgi:hypothetical protein